MDEVDYFVNSLSRRAKHCMTGVGGFTFLDQDMLNRDIRLPEVKLVDMDSYSQNYLDLRHSEYLNSADISNFD